MVFGIFFFFKQKTAYEMRISDWSSDVCSSDLGIERVSVDRTRGLVVIAFVGHPFGGAKDVAEALPYLGAEHGDIHIAVAGLVNARGDAGGVVVAGGCGDFAVDQEIGRAACRERVCRYV